jgi:hypothetical protein
MNTPFTVDQVETWFREDSRPVEHVVIDNVHVWFDARNGRVIHDNVAENNGRTVLDLVYEVRHPAVRAVHHGPQTYGHVSFEVVR